MRRTRVGATLAVAVGLSIAFAFAAGAQVSISVTMTGAAETDGAGNFNLGDPDGVATGTVTFDPVADTISWDFAYSHITGANISGFHIHGPNATPATVAGVFVGFPLSSTTVPDGTQVGMLTNVGAQVDQILANPAGFYVNLHSGNPDGFPSGAVRAQLPEPGTVGLILAGGVAMLVRRRRRGRAL